ncbi:MAG: beta-ketoacyl-ACP synthase [Geminicoccaceae bacterium]
MQPLEIAAMTAVSALGRGLAAHAAALVDGRSGLRANDFPHIDLACHIGRVDGLEEGGIEAPFDCRNNRLASLALATDGFAERVAACVRRYGSDRVAVVVGTSTSGILSTEEAYRRRPSPDAPLPEFDYRHTHDMGSLALYVRSALGLRGPASVVSTACSSGAKAFKEGAALIETGFADAAIVGGTDTLCGTTLYGFASLDVLDRQPCRPFAADRAGISLGEAAAFALLEPAQGRERVRLEGVGSSVDAHHMSAPHPEGLGAVLAMRAALESAGLEPASIDYVNAHGTGTRLNDAVEDQALVAVFGEDGPWCSSTKGQTGHTLGTAGALEAVLSTLALERGIMPGGAATAGIDPALRSRVLARTRSEAPRRVLSNSFGFGGNNCSLVLAI